jgi:arylsulfatase A-like enzyme
VISLDTLRADHLGAYGYPRATSPTLDALAKRGVVFDDASSPSPWTLPAHASLFTGLYPSRHGVKETNMRLNDSVPTLALLLRKAGWTTASVVNSTNVGPGHRLDRGFGEFKMIEEAAVRREPTVQIVDQAIAWAKRFRDRKLFMFVHTYDVHSDYSSLPQWEQLFVRPYSGMADGTTAQLMAFREGKARLGAADVPHLLDLYDAGIRQADEEMKRFFDALEREHLLEGSLIVVLSDHGEEFLEHGGVLHGRTQYQELTRVPLIVAGPGVMGGRHTTAPVSLLDLMPTILKRVSVPRPEALDGEDIGGLLDGKPVPALDGRFRICEADHNNPVLDTKRAIIRGQYKLHWDRTTQETALFDLTADAGERTNVAASHPDVVRDLRKQLDRFQQLRAVVGPPIEQTPGDIEKLRSLGYVR